MKNLKMLKQALLFMLMFMLIFSLEGCGGGGGGPLSSSNSQEENTGDEIFAGISEDILAQLNDDPEVLRVVDKILSPDKYGVPAIFDYAPLPENIDASQSTSGTPLNFETLYIFSQDLNKDGEFVTSVALEQDTQYIIKYSRAARTLNGSYLDLRITAPENQVMVLDLIGGHVKSSLDIDFEDRGIVSKSIYVDTECEFIPEENPCIMLYSFKAPVTGNYEFAIKELNQYDINSDDIEAAYEEILKNELPFEFRIYTVGEAHSALDGEEKKFTARQILDIQRILLEAAVDFDDCLLPTAFDESSEYEEYGEDGNFALTAENNSSGYRDKAYNVVKNAQDSNNSGKVVIPSRLDVPYDRTFAPGAGIYAHSGLRSIQLTALYDDIFSDSAIKDFTIAPPRRAFMETKLAINNVSTEEEFLRLKGMDSNSDITLLKDALDNKNSLLARLGLAGTKTLYLRYEERENSYRMPEFDKIELRPEAIHELKEDYGTFRREFGDYFVAGYQFGLVYEALIDIRAELFNSNFYLREKHTYLVGAEGIVDYIAKKIKEAISKNDADALKNLEEDLTKSWNVTISFSSVRASGMTEDAHISSLSELLKSLNDFKEKARQTPSSQYQRLYATLLSYREIANVKKYIPEGLPITAEHYKLIRDLNKAVYLTRCYKNALGSIPADHLINGTGRHNEWNSEYQKLSSAYHNQLNKLCSDIGFVRDYLNKFNELLEKYRALNHRYVLYRKMFAEQKSYPTTRRAMWEDSYEGWNYPCCIFWVTDAMVACNKTTAQDLKDSSSIYSREIYGITDDLDRIQRCYTFGSDARIYHYEGGPINTNGSSAWDNKGTSFGKKSYDWEFERSSNRMEFKVEFKVISMPDDKYPFTGLID